MTSTKQQIQVFLAGLIIIWIVYLLVFVLPTYGSHPTVVSAGVFIIVGSSILLVIVTLAGTRPQRVRPVEVPETIQTAKIKENIQEGLQDVSQHRTLARKYLIMGEEILRSVLGDTRVGLGYYAKAEEELLKIVSLDPDDSESYLHLAGAHVRLGKNRDAEKEFLRAMAIDPANVEYKIVYSRFLDNIEENYYEAEAILKQAVDIPHSPEMEALIHYSLHFVYGRLGNYGRKDERSMYRQNAESELKKIFPEWDSKNYEVSFINDKNAAGWSEGIYCGKIGFWKVGPEQRQRRTYSKIIELKNAPLSLDEMTGFSKD